MVIGRARFAGLNPADSGQERSPTCTPPPRPEQDPSTYADGLLNGTWDYVIPNDSELSESVISDLELRNPDKLRIRIGFDDHEWWQGFIADGERVRYPSGVGIGDGGTFVIDGDEMHQSTQSLEMIYRWELDGDELTLTMLSECNKEITPPECFDTREAIEDSDPFVLLITEHTYTKSGDDPSS